MKHDRRQKDRRVKDGKPANNRRATGRREKIRREGPRLPLELWMEEMAGDDIYFRRTGDVSIGGAYFDHAIPHELGTLVTLKFCLPGDQEMVVARGKVVRGASENGLGMGIKFISIEGNGEQRIRSHLRENS